MDRQVRRTAADRQVREAAAGRGAKEAVADRKTREAVRYLGLGGREADARTFALIRDCFEELARTVNRRIVFRVFDIERTAEGQMIIGTVRTDSRDLARNLEGCDRAALLGATLGIETDMLMKRYSYTDMARVIVLQACAAALLEEYIDGWQEGFAGEMREQGLYLRPRFSPGYGDLSVLCQKDILLMLDASKKIGLSVTDGSMLTPTKSVTAFIGLSRTERDCGASGCSACGSADCPYRA